MNEKKKIRKTFRDSVLSRDNNTCVMCENTEELDAHHITDRTEMVNGGYTKYNGISLCQDCHKKAEVYHKTNKREYIENYHPDDLYKMINSSFELANQKSLDLI